MKNNVFESLITSADAKEVFKDASKLRNNPTGLGKLFRNPTKKAVEFSDLHNEWKNQGFPDDTRDIEKILTKFGFSNKDINKIFSGVFGKSGSTHAEPVASPVVQKIANYAIKADLKDELKQFMQEEFGEELGLKPKKFSFNDIKKVFKESVNLIDNINEQHHLGRRRK